MASGSTPSRRGILDYAPEGRAYSSERSEAAFFFSEFRIPTSEFFYMPYALFARNPQPAYISYR